MRKTGYQQKDRLVHEQWDSQSGSAASIDSLKSVVASLNLAGLATLKDQGVKKN